MKFWVLVYLIDQNINKELYIGTRPTWPIYIELQMSKFSEIQSCTDDSRLNMFVSEFSENIYYCYLLNYFSFSFYISLSILITVYCKIRLWVEHALVVIKKWSFLKDFCAIVKIDKTKIHFLISLIGYILSTGQTVVPRLLVSLGELKLFTGCYLHPFYYPYPKNMFHLLPVSVV